MKVVPTMAAQLKHSLPSTTQLFVSSIFDMERSVIVNGGANKFSHEESQDIHFSAEAGVCFPNIMFSRCINVLSDTVTSQTETFIIGPINQWGLPTHPTSHVAAVAQWPGKKGSYL